MIISGLKSVQYSLIRSSLRWSSSSRAPVAPAEFREIANRDSILSEIDVCLGRTKPPSIEYIYVESDFQLFLSSFSGGSASASNPYGHAALRYTLGSHDFTINISGARGKDLLNIMPTQDYIFGCAERTHAMGSDQGGVYLRAMRGFRIEDVPERDVLALHEYFVALQQRHREGTAKYSLLWGNTLPLVNAMSSVEQGNCSYFTSRGMVKSRLFEKPSMWPKILFIKCYLQMSMASHNPAKVHTLFHPSNINIVAYRKEAAQDKDPLANSWIAPTFLFSSQARTFKALERFANAVVVTPARPNDPSLSWRSNVVLQHPFRPFINQ